MTASHEYVNALLEGDPDEEAQQLLLTAVETGRFPYLTSELWYKRHVLTAANKKRFLTGRNLLPVFLEGEEVASSVEVREHPERRAILRLFLEELRGHDLSPGETVEGKGFGLLLNLRKGILAAPVEQELFTELSLLATTTLWRQDFHRHADLVPLLTLVLDKAAGTEQEETVTWNALYLLGKAKEAAGETTQDEYEALYQKCLSHPVTPQHLAANPDLLTAKVLALHPSGEGLVAEVMNAAAKVKQKNLHRGIFKNEDPVVRDLVTEAIKWNGVDAYHCGADELRRRAIEHVAGALAGNRAAQEVLWGLADEWEGTVGGLVQTALGAVK